MKMKKEKYIPWGAIVHENHQDPRVPWPKDTSEFCERTGFQSGLCGNCCILQADFSAWSFWRPPRSYFELSGEQNEWFFQGIYGRLRRDSWECWSSADGIGLRFRDVELPEHWWWAWWRWWSLIESQEDGIWYRSGQIQFERWCVGRSGGFSWWKRWKIFLPQGAKQNQDILEKGKGIWKRRRERKFGIQRVRKFWWYCWSPWASEILEPCPWWSWRNLLISSSEYAKGRASDRNSGRLQPKSSWEPALYPWRRLEEEGFGEWKECCWEIEVPKSNRIGFIWQVKRRRLRRFDYF